MLMLGQDVVIDPEKFLVQGNQIHVLGKEPLAPVNFAACWNSGGRPENYIDVAATVDAAHFLVPPILFSETDDSYHLQFDFFRNTWMVKHRQLTVPVPRIRDLGEMGFDPDYWDSDWGSRADMAEAYPWMSAVVLDQDLSGESEAAPWWVDGIPVFEELTDFLDIADEYEYEDDEEDEPSDAKREDAAHDRKGS
jgi:hypothetical protein